MDDVAESFGSAFTADAIFALSAPEELAEVSQLLVKQLKNRFGDVHRTTRFVIGVDRPRFKILDVKQDAGTGESEVAPRPQMAENRDKYALLN
jgi:hypothetical protein